MRVVYYVPDVSDVPSTTRYNHAIALASLDDAALLITHSTPPDKVAAAYDEVWFPPGSPENTDGFIEDISTQVGQTGVAAERAERFLGDDGVFVTTFHYRPALTGFRADVPWVVDVYDDPYQYIFQAPKSSHQLKARLLSRVLERADRAVHTVHPASPRLYGREKLFAVNGAPTNRVSPVETGPRDPLRCVWLGKPRLDRGMQNFLRALRKVDSSVAIDIFGAPYEGAVELAGSLGVSDQVTFHGHQPHHEITEAIESAHLGLALYPPRADWRYCYPIKIGEYLAGGVIPLASAFPGMRELARGAGVYAAPMPEAVAARLDALASLPTEEFGEMQSLARERAEAISWRDERKWFATQALGTETPGTR